MPKLLTKGTAAEGRKLFKHYVTFGKTIEEVAKIMGWSVRTVYNQLKFHGISRNEEEPTAKYCVSCGRAMPKEEKVKKSKKKLSKQEQIWQDQKEEYEDQQRKDKRWKPK